MESRRQSRVYFSLVDAAAAVRSLNALPCEEVFLLVVVVVVVVVVCISLIFPSSSLVC